MASDAGVAWRRKLNAWGALSRKPAAQLRRRAYLRMCYWCGYGTANATPSSALIEMPTCAPTGQRVIAW
jgi:hypothetical protein